MELPIILFLVCCFCGAIAGVIGVDRNQGCFAAFLGFCFGPIGILIACVLPVAAERRRPLRSPTIRTTNLDYRPQPQREETGDPLDFLR